MCYHSLLNSIFMWENKSKLPLENNTNVSEEKERERRGGREGENVFDVLIQSKYMIERIKIIIWDNLNSVQGRCKLISNSSKGQCRHTVTKYTANKALNVIERKDMNVLEHSKPKLKIVFSTDWDCNWASQLYQRAQDIKVFACHIYRSFSVLRRLRGFGASTVWYLSYYISIYNMTAISGCSVLCASWNGSTKSLLWSQGQGRIGLHLVGKWCTVYKGKCGLPCQNSM